MLMQMTSSARNEREESLKDGVAAIKKPSLTMSVTLGICYIIRSGEFLSWKSWLELDL